MKTFQTLYDYLLRIGFSLVSSAENSFYFTRDKFHIVVIKKDPNIIKRISIKKDCYFKFLEPELIFDKKRPGKSSIRQCINLLSEDWKKAFIEFYDAEYENM